MERTSGDGERALAPEEALLDHPAREERTGDAHDAQNNILNAGVAVLMDSRSSSRTATYIAVCDIERAITEIGTPRLQENGHETVVAASQVSRRRETHTGTEALTEGTQAR